MLEVLTAQCYNKSMNHIEISKKYAKNTEERELLSRVCDLIQLSAARYCECYSHFLTPVQQQLLKKIPDFGWEVDLSFEGGYSEAERRIAVIRPKDYLVESLFSPVAVLSIQTREQNFTHRDVLGSLMGLGIVRNRLGDILDGSKPPLIFCEPVLVDFLLQNFSKIGKIPISLKQVVLTPEEYKCVSFKKTENFAVTVSSLRLDAVVAEGFGLSRAKAAEAIKRGLVFLNWNMEERLVVPVKEGDKISLRGKGKMEIAEIGGISRKGRTYLQVIRYI